MQEVDSWTVSVDPSHSLEDRVQKIKNNMDRIDQEVARIDAARTTADSEQFKADLLASKARSQVLLWRQYYQDRIDHSSTEASTPPKSAEEQTDTALAALSAADPTDTERTYQSRLRTQQLKEKSYLLEACILYQQVSLIRTLHNFKENSQYYFFLLSLNSQDSIECNSG